MLQSEVGDLKRKLEAAEAQGRDLSHRLNTATGQITELERQADVQVRATFASMPMIDFSATARGGFIAAQCVACLAYTAVYRLHAADA